MKIVINTSNLYVGGGFQVALSFLNELKQEKKNHEYHVFLSQAINEELDQEHFPDNFYFYLFEKSPAPLKTRNIIVTKLNNLETQIKADIVFTIFGPSYWRPKAKHLLGFADGWVYNPDSIAFDKLAFLSGVKMRLQCIYKKFYIKKDANYFVLETHDAKMKLANTAGIVESKIFVVGNTYSSIFNNEKYFSPKNEFFVNFPKKTRNEFRLIYIAHNHPSKNLSIINKVIPFLEGCKVTFVLTIDAESFKNIFSKQTNSIINIGPIPPKSCPSVYKQCDALFAPTLLETFSASYPEAMKMEIPILTSSYSFAKDVCQDAALYFDPINPKDIAKKIKQLIDDKALQDALVKRGKQRVQEFETAKSRAEKYVALCERLINL